MDGHGHQSVAGGEACTTQCAVVQGRAASHHHFGQLLASRRQLLVTGDRLFRIVGAVQARPQHALELLQTLRCVIHHKAIARHDLHRGQAREIQILAALDALDLDVVLRALAHFGQRAAVGKAVFAHVQQSREYARRGITQQRLALG